MVGAGVEEMHRHVYIVGSKNLYIYMYMMSRFLFRVIYFLFIKCYDLQGNFTSA